MRSAAALPLVIAAVAGCGGGGDDGYPDEAVESFVSECAKQPNATESACRCVIDRLQVSMPYEEFERADAALRGERAPEEASLAKLQAAARGCLGG